MTNTIITQQYFNAKQLILPLDFAIKIEFDDVVRTFDEVMRGIELKKYLVSQKTNGRIGYNPVKMLKMIMFCHMEKIYSLRDMEKACKTDIRVMWLTDEMKPSHQAIKRFMDDYLKQGIDEIFHEINQYLIQIEKIETKRLYIDGTKIEANANRYTFVWTKATLKYRKKLFGKISKALTGLNSLYASEGVYFKIKETYQITDLSNYVSFLEVALEKDGTKRVYGKGNHKTALQRYYDQMNDYLGALIKYEQEIEISGSDRNSYSKTDHDATFMRMKEDHMKNGQLKPGYNIQIGVSDEYIMHMDISQERNDIKTFIPFLEGYHHFYQSYPTYPVADAGYGGFGNYKYCKEHQMGLYQKFSMYAKQTGDKKYREDPFRAENFKQDEKGNYICPQGRKMKFLRHKSKKDGPYTREIDTYQSETCKRCPLRNKCAKGKQNRQITIDIELQTFHKEVIANLTSELGIELRIQRSIQVEGAFGVIKEAMNFRRFRRRGMKSVKMEFILVAIGYNLMKYHNKKYRVIQ
ncbi:MAG: IS1182 family transposase [Bacillota bacterium]